MRRTNDTTALPVIAWIFAASVALLLTAEVTLAAGGKPLDEPEEQRGRQQAVDCGKRICPGSTVFAKERYKKNIIKGMAEKVLEEGPTRTEWLVRFDDGSMERYYDEDLSSDRPYCNYNDPTTLYNDGIGLYCVGDRVVNVAQYNSWNSNRLRHGHIVGGKGFDSWIVQLEGDDSSQFYEHSGIELAHANSKHCGTHACVEDQVLDRNSPPRPGSVIAITNDGLEYVIEYTLLNTLVDAR